MPPNNHKRLSASSMHRWSQCPGSIRLSEGIESKSSVYAAEGSAVHYLCEHCLSTGKDAAYYLGNCIVHVDGTHHSIALAKNDLWPGWEVDQEMVECVQLYLNTVRCDLSALPGAVLEIEKTFDLSELHPDLGGTCDAIVAQPWGKLIVYDYKHGAGYPVEVENNPQAMYYGLGAYLGLDYDEIELVIVQPRARHKDGPVRRWVLDPRALMEWAEGVLLPAAKATEAQEASVNPGDHCRFCPALKTCRGFADHAMEVAKTDFQAIPLPSPDHLSEGDLLKVLASADLLKTWLGEVFAHAQKILEGGGNLPGWKLVQKKTNRQWTDEREVVKALYPKYKAVLEVYDKKIKSVAQLERLIKQKGLDVDLSPLVEKPEGGLTLAPESDRRPAVTPAMSPEFIPIEQ